MFSMTLGLAETFYKFLKLLCSRVFLTLNSSTDTNSCVHLNVCLSRRSIWLYRGNTITGKPIVFILTHKGKNPNQKEVNAFSAVAVLVFTIRGPILWNGLKYKTRIQDDVVRFKVALKKCNLEQSSYMKRTCINLNKNLDDFFYYQSVNF